MREFDPTKHILLEIGDGPEGFTFYTSENEAVVDWAHDFPALYLTASVNGAFVKLGPFHLSSIRERLIAALKPDIEHEPVFEKRCAHCGANNHFHFEVTTGAVWPCGNCGKQIQI